MRNALTGHSDLSYHSVVADDRPCVQSPYTYSLSEYGLVNKNSHNGHRRHHRQVYAEYHGVALSKDDVIMHTCDNPGCIEITHLVKGTQRQNVADAMRKGRLNNQGNRYAALLERADVIEIWHQYQQGALQRELSDQFQVTQSTISHILSGHTWKDVYNKMTQTKEN